MNNVIQYLAFILPIIATLCVLTVVCINLYLKIRRKFPVNVNCWFCNEWTKVHYDNYNSFHCPKCLQYNGFNENGDYNKALPEQHDELLNQQVPLMRRHNEFKSSNGLCHICNNNQKLKIYQLANFVPLNEDAFDIEVEHFQKQLEKAYKLCVQCEQVVKNVIRTKNKWVLGMKVSNMKNKGLSFLDLNKSSDSLSRKRKRLLFLYFLNIMLILFASFICIFAFCQIHFSKYDSNKQLSNYIKSYANPVVYILNKTYFELMDVFGKYVDLNIIRFYDNLNSSSVIVENVIHRNISYFYKYTKHIDINILKSFKLNSPDINLLCITGLFFQLVSIFFNKNTAFKNIKQVALWCSLLAITWSQNVDEFTAIIYMLQVTTSAFIIYSFFTCEKKNIKVHMKKINNKDPVQNKVDFQEDLSDHEDNLTNYFSIGDYAPAHNSTLKYKVYNNETDTANSDCSFESIKSKYTFAESPFRSPPIKGLRSPVARCEADHIFGARARFTSPLSTSSPLFKQSFYDNYVPKENSMGFRSLNNRNDTEQFMSGQKTNPSVDNFFRSFDLNESLDKLHLGNRKSNFTRSRKVPIKILKNNFPRPILSPPKLVFVNHKGYVSDDSLWKNFKDTNYYKNNISSSSSQSSGFASQCNEFSDVKYQPHVPWKNSFSDDDRNSLMSEEFYREKYKNYRTNVLTRRDPWKHVSKIKSKLNNEENSFRPIRNTSNLENERIVNWNKQNSELSPTKTISNDSLLGQAVFCSST